MYKKILFIIVAITLIPIVSNAQKTEIIKLPENILYEANTSFDEKKYALAYQLYTKYIDQWKSIDKDGLELAYYQRALSSYHLSNNDADIHLRGFLAQYPNSSYKNNIHFVLGNFYQSKEEFEDAIRVYKQMNEDNLTREEKLERHYFMGYSYFNLMEYEDAKDNFIRVKDTKTKYSSPSTYYYAHILYEEANYTQALREFKSLANDRSFRNIVPYYIVQINYIQGNYTELIKNARQLSQSGTSKKRTVQINKMIGEAYCKLERYEEAIPYLEKGVKDNPDSKPGDNYLLGYSLVKNNREKESIEYLKNATSNRDSLAQNAFYHLGYAYIGVGDKQQARTSFKEAYDLGFDKDIKEDALLNYAKLSYELPDPFNETLKSFQTYYDNYPNSKKINEVREYLAQLYGASKNYQDAIKLIEEMPRRTKSIDEAYQKILVNRGIELMNEGRDAEAARVFDKSIKINSVESLTLAGYYLRSEVAYRQKDFNNAVINLNSFFKSKSSTSSEYYSKASYTLAYALFQNRGYSKSQYYFENFIKSSKNESPKLIADAYNRIGDTYFMNKNFDRAIENYDRALKLNIIDQDYSLYQKSICLGAKGSLQTKTNILKQALDRYPNSTYRASILFELANSYLVIEQYNQALNTYEMVVNEYPNSSNTKSAISKMGLIYYKQGKDELALTTLDKLVKSYPTSQESKDGLKSIRQIHIDQNRVEEYYDYVQSIPNVNYSLGEKDSISFEAVENLYMSGDCDKSIDGFRNYIKEFKNGFFAINANFYLADCLMKKGEKQEALESYLMICNSPNSKFTEISLMNASELLYQNQDYKQAIELFTRLDNQAEVSSHKSRAKIGNMRSYYKLGVFDTAIHYGNQVLLDNKNTEIVLDEAEYIIAKSSLENGLSEDAYRGFEKLKDSRNGDYSGEANYIFAEKSFKEAKLDESESIILNYSSNPTSEYWLAKAIILLGDIYVEKDKEILAKQTYQSIVDNYDGDELIELAQNKINAILYKDEVEDQGEEVKTQEVEEIIISEENGE